MTRLDEIIANALAGIPETDVAILAREVVRLRGERAVVVPEPDSNSAGLVKVRSWIGAIGPVGAMVWIDPWEAMKAAGVRTIPADRVLGDGMVAASLEVVAKDYDFLAELEGHLEAWRERRDVTSADLAQEMVRDWKDELRAKLDALRANQGGAAT